MIGVLKFLEDNIGIENMGHTSTHFLPAWEDRTRDVHEGRFTRNFVGKCLGGRRSLKGASVAIVITSSFLNQGLNIELSLPKETAGELLTKQIAKDVGQMMSDNAIVSLFGGELHILGKRQAQNDRV